jgi:hypothetical protein
MASMSEFDGATSAGVAAAPPSAAASSRSAAVGAVSATYTAAAAVAMESTIQLQEECTQLVKALVLSCQVQLKRASEIIGPLSCQNANCSLETCACSSYRCFYPSSAPLLEETLQMCRKLKSLSRAILDHEQAPWECSLRAADPLEKLLDSPSTSLQLNSATVLDQLKQFDCSHVEQQTVFQYRSLMESVIHSLTTAILPVLQQMPEMLTAVQANHAAELQDFASREAAGRLCASQKLCNARAQTNRAQEPAVSSEEEAEGTHELISRMREDTESGQQMKQRKEEAIERLN